MAFYPPFIARCAATFLTLSSITGCGQVADRLVNLLPASIQPQTAQPPSLVAPRERIPGAEHLPTPSARTQHAQSVSSAPSSPYSPHKSSEARVPSLTQKKQSEQILTVTEQQNSVNRFHVDPEERVVRIGPKGMIFDMTDDLPSIRVDREPGK